MKCLSADALIAVESIIAGFGVTALMFRLQRELSISDENWRRRATDPSIPRVRTWLPYADYLLIAAVLLALILGVRPLLVAFDESTLRLARAATAAATVLLAGYVPTILGHYRFLHGLHESRPLLPFWEGIFLVITVVGAIRAAYGASASSQVCPAG